MPTQVYFVKSRASKAVAINILEVQLISARVKEVFLLIEYIIGIKTYRFGRNPRQATQCYSKQIPIRIL